MGKKVKVAIVGRPNVGKSALFNRICDRRLAIVDEAEGVTRDRIYSDAEFFGFHFQAIDTGGINPKSQAAFNKEIKRQAEIAIEEADSLIMVVDSQVGITDLDQQIAKILLRTKKPVCLAVNKVDDQQQEGYSHQFRALGISKIVAVSAAQGWHIAELLEEALATFDKSLIEEIETTADIKVAIVGRPNVGKSSFVNYVLNEERCIVSPIPGTTRDSVDIICERKGTQFTLIDTAGIRKKQAEHEAVDKFAAIRSQRAIERADVCVLILDAQQGMTTQEKKIANMIQEAGKGCVILFNKWDLVHGFRMEHCLQSIQEEVPFLAYCPKIFTSAKTGRNLEKVFDAIIEVDIAAKTRITTHQLNKFLQAAMQRNHPPMIMGKRLRIYYMAQVSTEPPEFVMFINYPHLMIEAYKKYLINQFREEFAFTGVPLVFRLRGKERKELKREQRQPSQTLAPEAQEEPQIEYHEHFEAYDDDEEDDFDEEEYIFENEDEIK